MNAVGGKSASSYVFNVVIAPFRLILYVLQYLWLTLSNIKNLFDVLYNSFAIILILVAALIFGTIWFSYGSTIVEELEYLYRCEIFPVWEIVLQPIFNRLVEWYESIICWWNALGLINRLLTTKLVVNRLLYGCDNGFTILNLIDDIFKVFGQFLSITLRWFFTNNWLKHAYPAYYWLSTVINIFEEIGDMLLCLCGDMRIFVQWIIRILSSNDLTCMVHQLINSWINSIQVLIQTFIDMISFLFNFILMPGQQSASDIVESLEEDPPGFNLPSGVTTTERFSVAGIYLGYFLDDVLRKTICTIVAEFDADGDLNLVEPSYQACMNDPDTKTNIFCLIGPFLGANARLFRLIGIKIIFTLPRILNEITTNPPGPYFLLDEWRVDNFYDTIRDPPFKKDYSVDLNFPTIIPGSDASSIVQLNTFLYGNYTLPLNVSCTEINVDRLIVPCNNCSEVMEYDAEECLCLASVDLDRLLGDLVDFKLFDGTLCCLLGRVLRVYTAAAKFIQGLIVHIIHLERLQLFLTDQNNFDIPFDELVGPIDRVGGVLECCARIINAFDPRLECVCRLLATGAKAYVEAIRIGVIVIVRFLNDIWSTGELGFFDFVCLTKASCVDIENRVARHVRRPRLDLTFPLETPLESNINNTYTPIDETRERAFIDCASEILSLRFLNQFLDEPYDPLPDITCWTVYSVRFTIEAYIFAAEILLGLVETIETIYDQIFGNGTRPITFVIIEYLACDRADLCSPIPKLLSDSLDSSLCACTFIRALDDLINPNAINIPCLCDAWEAFIFYGQSTIQGTWTIGLAALKLVDCLFTGFPQPECSDLMLHRFESYYNYLLLSLDYLADLVGQIGCILGLLFRFDCIGSRYSSPADWEPCFRGSSFGVCSASDRLVEFFRRGWEVIQASARYTILLNRSIVLIAFNIPWNGFVGIADLIEEFLLTAGAPFWGTSATDVTPATTGFVHSVCYLISCIIGPPTDECINQPAPGIDNDSAGNCLGDIFCILGDAVRDIYAVLVGIIGSLVGILEALLTGNGDLLAERLIRLIFSVLELLAVLIGSLDILLQTIVAVVVAVIEFLFGEGVALIFDFFLSFVLSIAQIFIAIIEGLISIFVKKRTLVDLYYNTTGDLKENPFQNPITFGAKVWENWNSIQESNAISNLYYLHFKNAIIALRSNDTGSAREDDGQKRSQEETEFMEKTYVMKEMMVKDSFCQKLMVDMEHKRSMDEISRTDGLFYQYCSMAYFFPIAANTYDQHGKDSQNPTIHYPDDVLYNPLSFIGTIKDVAMVMKEYIDWNTQSVGFSDGGVYSSVEEVPSWVWEYEINGSKGVGKRNHDYIFEANESFERLNNHTAYIHLPNQQISVPIIDGRYSRTYESVTFEDVLNIKKINSPTAKSLAKSLRNFKSQKRENNYLNLYSSVGNAAKAYLGRNDPNEKKKESSYFIKQRISEIYNVNEPFMVSSFDNIRGRDDINASNVNHKHIAGVSREEVKKLKEQNARYYRSHASRASSNQTEHKKRNDKTNTFSFDFIHHDVDAYYEKHMTKLENHIVTLKRMLPDWKDKVWFKTKFNYTHYFYHVVPTSITSVYHRMIGKVNVTEELFKHVPKSERYPHYKRYYHVNESESNHTKVYDKNDPTITVNPIKTKYGHILGNKSLIGHRFELLSNVTFIVLRNFTSRFHYRSILKRFKSIYVDKYLKKYSDTIRVKKRTPTLYKPFALFLRLRETIPILKQITGEINHNIYDFMENGHPMYDDNGQSLRTIPFLTPEVKKRIHLPVLIPICLPGADDELVCTECDACPSNLCSNCRSCRNCTQVILSNGATCERCADCSAGGGNCPGPCVNCRPCARESACLDCIVVEDFIAAAVDIVLYCVALENNDTSVIRTPRENVTLIEIVDRNETESLELYDDVLSDLIFNQLLPLFTDIDIGSTIVKFISNTNQDPFDGPLGLLFWVRNSGILPYQSCNRDINLSCTFGVGLRDGLIYATIIILILSVVMQFLFPPIGGIIDSVVSIVGWVILWLFLVVSISWFYNLSCLATPQSLLTLFVFPISIPLPMFPVCAVREIVDLLNEIIVECIPIPVELTANNETCPVCDEKLELVSCKELGFTNQFTQIGFILQFYAPGVSDYLNTTCLVQGGCLFGAAGTGPLAAFFEVNFDVETNGDQLLTCFLFTLPGLLASLLFIYVGYQILSVLLPWFLSIPTFLVGLLLIPPFIYLIPWPFKELLVSYAAGGLGGSGEADDSSLAASGAGGGGGGSRGGGAGSGSGDAQGPGKFARLTRRPRRNRGRGKKSKSKNKKSKK